MFNFKNTKTGKQLLLTALLITALLLSSCSLPNKSRANYISDTAVCLDTFITITLYGCSDKSILKQCFLIVNQYQNIYSRTLNYSELYKINQSHERRIAISDEMAEIIKIGLKYGEITDGSFDLTIGSVSSLWDFKADEPALPTQSSIEAALPHIDYRKISVEEVNGQYYLIKEDENVILELGGIAKGYIADRVKDYLISVGVESALIDLGGNILCVGAHQDGSPFHIGILEPFSENTYITTVNADDCSVVTSGSYQRYFELNDKLYHHILNPADGYPVENGLLSVTILSKSSVDADALSTSCFILGEEKGLELIDSLEDTYAIFIDSNMKITCSKGLK